MQNRYLIKELASWMQIMGYAKTTIQSKSNYLQLFFNWLTKHKIDLEKITSEDIQSYSNYLHKQPLRSVTIKNYVFTINLLDKYYQTRYGKKLLKKEIEVEKGIKTEKDILTQEEVKKLYKRIENTHEGQLDRVLIGLYYGCGLRLQEGANLEIEHIDFKHNLIEIIKTKNRTNRFIPLTIRIRQDIINYIKYTRRSCSKYLLINILTGNPIKTETIYKRIKQLNPVREKQITPHCLRHSIATHLLETGMQIEQISQFLGHKSLIATQIYVRWR